MNAPAEHHEVLRDEISQTITKLGIHLDLVRALVTTNQRSLIGFLTPEGRQALDEQKREERRGLAHAHDGRGDDVGLRFLNADTPTRVTVSRAPLNMSPASFEAYAWATLQQLVTTATRHLIRRDALVEQTRGWCALPKTVRDIHLNIDNDGALVWPEAPQLAAHLRVLCWDIRRYTVLENTLREVTHLNELAETVVEGAGQTHLGECPHCGRDTLVVHFRGDRENPGTQFVRCGKDPKTGNHETCTCGSAWCPCKDKPVTHRHTWWRSTRSAPDPRTAHDWHDLASRLNIRRATKEPTP